MQSSKRWQRNTQVIMRIRNKKRVMLCLLVHHAEFTKECITIMLELASFSTIRAYVKQQVYVFMRGYSIRRSSNAGRCLDVGTYVVVTVTVVNANAKSLRHMDCQWCKVVSHWCEEKKIDYVFRRGSCSTDYDIIVYGHREWVPYSKLFWNKFDAGLPAYLRFVLPISYGNTKTMHH